MITKDQASQAADELMAQQNDLRNKDRMAKAYLSSRYFRSPELNRLSLKDQRAVLQTARRAVAKDRVVNFWFILLLLAPIIAVGLLANEKSSSLPFYLGFAWVLLLWNLRKAVVKRVAQWLARDMPPAQNK
jgi:Flp pilus assembly protein TadB